MNSKITTLLAGFALTTTAFGKTIPNNAAADLVLGQPNFTSNLSPRPPNANSLSSPYAVSIDLNTGKVFVADTSNNRILRYASSTALANGTAAEYVFGSDVFTDPKPWKFTKGFNGPSGIFVDRSGRLWVADRDNNRVMGFENASLRTDTNPAATRIFGQPDFAGILPGSRPGQMNNPYGVFVDSRDRLWVADTGNSVVLRFDDITNKANGTAENAYLYSDMKRPTGVFVTPSDSLFVADRGNQRVIRIDGVTNSPPNAVINAVLGQPNLTSFSAVTTATGMSDPQGVFITPDDTLWVMDSFNNRILRFNNASTKTTGSAADGVVGQASFTTNTAANTDRGFGGLGFQATVDASGNLWVPDLGNSRVLRFSPVDPPPVIVPPVVVVDKTAPLLVLSTKIPKLVTKPQLLLKGTASDASGIKSVQYRLGKAALKTAKGTTTWQIKLPLKKGKNTLTLLATDTAGNVSLNKVIKINRK
jgi:sugar lactone lactonase YvrE